MSEITAKSLILDLLSSLRGGEGDASMPVAALVAAGELFELEGNAVRVALARLLAAGLVARDDRGSYRLGRGAQEVSARVFGWRRMSGRTRAWRGGWVAACGTSAARGRAAREDARAKRLLGMQPLSDGLFVRPDNLVGGVSEAREQLGRLGLAPDILVVGMQGLDEVTQRRACGLWDTKALSEGYLRSRGELSRSVRRLQKLSRERAMVETFLVGGAVLRQLALDPLLPAELIEEQARSALLRDLSAYDDLGREHWGRFLAGFGVTHRRVPVDARIGQAPELTLGTVGQMDGEHAN